ncbi:MAG: recombinase family protein [Clostridiales bacterium]|nr:recombinase family protein [Clostridiales bacterium]
MQYQVAIYLRLSREDKEAFTDYQKESNSISSQRTLIENFINKQEDMVIYNTYVDDGWSGVHFNRPGFLSMMKDIEEGVVNCVIVKDLSRLGRDYIEVGRLIQKTFPAFFVRFIAINDNFDSVNADFSKRDLMIPVKNFMNDFYCRDISKKVRSCQKIKREKGEFIGAFPVYGYKRDADNRHHLVVDEEAACIVKKIFQWKIEGYSPKAIADKLSEAGVLSPYAYKKSKGEHYFSGFVREENTQWSQVTVRRILQDETYLGTLVQGKTGKLNFKMKKTQKKEKEEWVRVLGMHEPLIKKEDFELVERLLMADCRASNKEKPSYKFAGFLYCGDCREQMHRRINHNKTGDRIYYICGTYNRGKGCSRHSIAEEVLEQKILEQMRTIQAEKVDRKLLATVVEKIYVYQKNKVEIIFAITHRSGKTERTL